MNRIGRVLVGVSGSAASLEALRTAHHLARLIDRPLVAITVWDLPNRQRHGVPQPVLDDCRGEAHARLRTAFDEAMGGPPRDVDLTCLVVRGVPGPALVTIADRVDDVLVVGRSHRRLTGALFLARSVDAHCVRHAPGCVLVTTPPPLLDAARRPRVDRWESLLDAG